MVTQGYRYLGGVEYHWLSPYHGDLRKGGHVTLSEPKRRVWAYRVLGYTLIVVAFLAIVLVCLKYFYIQTPVLKRNNSIDQILSLLPTWDNYLVFMSCALWVFMGLGIVKYANNLNSRIRNTEHAIEEDRWRLSLGQTPANVDVLTIQLESQEHWYKRPSGLILIGLVSTVIAKLIDFFFKIR